MGSCKKQDACLGIVCDSNSHCENGVCVCDTGWTGSDCSIHICQQNHTGSIKIINQGYYDYDYMSTGGDTGYINANKIEIINDLPVDSYQFYFLSTQTCFTSPMQPGGHPCRAYHPTIIVNECQQTTYIIP